MRKHRQVFNWVVTRCWLCAAHPVTNESILCLPAHETLLEAQQDCGCVLALPGRGIVPGGCPGCWPGLKLEKPFCRRREILLHTWQRPLLPGASFSGSGPAGRSVPEQQPGSQGCFQQSSSCFTALGLWTWR